MQLPDPLGLDVCRHNTIILYVNYDYCANNLMPRSCYEGGIRLLLPLKWDQMSALFYVTSRWPCWSCSAVEHGRADLPAFKPNFAKQLKVCAQGGFGMWLNHVLQNSSALHFILSFDEFPSSNGGAFWSSCVPNTWYGCSFNWRRIDFVWNDSPDTPKGRPDFKSLVYGSSSINFGSYISHNATQQHHCVYRMGSRETLRAS